MQRLIEAQATASAIREQARRGGMRSLLEDGVCKVVRGVTTAREVAMLATHDDVAPEMRAIA